MIIFIMVKIAFHDNCLSERGTAISVFDYAYYNKHYLKNESIIMYDKNDKRSVDDVIEKFRAEFKLCPYENWNRDANIILQVERCDILYMQKAGGWDGKFANPLICKTIVHCVFTTDNPHGHIYARISNSFGDKKYPVVNYMVNLPNVNANMRNKIGIPINATVFGRIGGIDEFDIQAVHQAIDRVTDDNPNIYFFLVNTKKFCKDKKNIIHYGKIINLEKKVQFINSCDAMIHARAGGETFGAAVAEFSIKNKPVITCPCTIYDSNNSHINILKEKAILYDMHNMKEIYNIFNNFDKSKVNEKNWNAYSDYLPEKVMDKFNDVFIKPLLN